MKKLCTLISYLHIVTTESLLFILCTALKKQFNSAEQGTQNKDGQDLNLMSRSLKPGFYLSCRKCLTSCRTLENTVSPHGTALISANGQIAIIPPVMRVTNPNGSQVAGESREIVLFFF